MHQKSFFQRSSGILAHITSLPSPFGIGDIGNPSHEFLNYLVSAGQRYWQILPTVPTSLIFDSSPYMSTSAFAGSPLLISPEGLVQQGLIGRQTLDMAYQSSPYLVDYPTVYAHKKMLLAQAYQTFAEAPDESFKQFCTSAAWLEDYALFMALKDLHQGKPWYEWPPELASRSGQALAEARDLLARQVDYYRFEQYLFTRQWHDLHQQAKQLEIDLIGDIPIYVGLDSADVWAYQDIFDLDRRTLRPSHVSGVPPDYFSPTGQRWGNPLYRWHSRDNAVKERLHAWWLTRFLRMFELVDVARIDHFRAFASYWSIPAQEQTAVNGKWVKGPGYRFFKRIESELGHLPIIAEDLGEITPAVIKLRDMCNFPGMKVLQFAFDGNPANPFLPHNFSTDNCVVYTGTHDNDTSVGWFLSDQLNESERDFIIAYANRQMHDNSAIHENLIYLALSSIARLAIIPLQDLLGFGSDCRMNTPGVPSGNWQWRCAPAFLSQERADWLREMTKRFGR